MNPISSLVLLSATLSPTLHWSTPTGSVAYDDQGQGPLVVCVPGMGDLRQEYRFLVPRLVEAGYRVVTVDLRGHGDSDASLVDPSVAGVGADLAGLIEHLGAGKARVLGDSMAAGAAVWLAAERPDLVEKVVLLGPAVRGRTDFWGALLYGTLFGGFWGPDVWVAFYDTLYPTKKPADFANYKKALRANLGQKGRMEALKRMILAPKDASESRLSSVKVPTLVLMGTKDPDFSKPEDEARFVAQATRGTYTMIEGAGHYPHAEFPEVTAPLVIDFLAR